MAVTFPDVQRQHSKEEQKVKIDDENSRGPSAELGVEHGLDQRRLAGPLLELGREFEHGGEEAREIPDGLGNVLEVVGLRKRLEVIHLKGRNETKS